MVSRVRLGLGVAMLAVAAGLYFKFGYLLSLHSIKVNRDWIAAEVGSALALTMIASAHRWRRISGYQRAYTCSQCASILG